MDMKELEKRDIMQGRKSAVIDDTIRDQILQHAKSFKTSWVSLGQSLFAVWQDKVYRTWGFEKFEHYTQEELGINKNVAIKLLKTYYFLEQDEPEYLQDSFADERDARAVPGFEEINVLRLAKTKKELLKDDYRTLKKSVFEKGKDAPAVRKDLTAIIKERKQVDGDEERDKRGEASLRKVINALVTFRKDMQTLQVLPADLADEAAELIDKLEAQLP